jgi:uncharacterized membrane protein
MKLGGVLWLVWVLGGLLWLAVVGVSLSLALESADAAAADGVIGDPEHARVFVAVASGVVFGVPGVGLIIMGVRRLKRGRSGGEAAE